MNGSLGFTEIDKNTEFEKEQKPVEAINKDRKNRTFKRRSGKAVNFLNSMQEDYLPEKTSPVPDEDDDFGTAWAPPSSAADLIKQNTQAHAGEHENYMLREGMEQQRQHYQKQETNKQAPTYTGIRDNIPYYTELTNSQEITGPKEDLMKKLNYVVHMLEEQQDQKTGSVTEEMVLYMFLGLFVIFVVDSFSKTGKYSRG